MALRDRTDFTTQDIYIAVQEYSPDQLFKALQDGDLHTLSRIIWERGIKDIKRDLGFKSFELDWLKNNDMKTYRQRVDHDTLVKAEHIKASRTFSSRLNDIADQGTREVLELANSVLNTMFFNGKSFGKMNMNDCRLAYNTRFTRSNTEFKQCYLLEAGMKKLAGKGNVLIENVLTGKEADAVWQSIMKKTVTLV